MKVVTFGEIMLRLAPTGFQRFTQARSFEAIIVARDLGITVSTDLNYRAKLWKWGKSAGEVMTELVGMCDVALGNEEDAEKVFGIKAPESDITAEKVDADHYRYVYEELNKKFPSLKTISITLRGSLSASHNTWSGVLWKDGTFYSAPVYNIIPIVDRVGGGDSFMGGLIYGLRKYDDPRESAGGPAFISAVMVPCPWHRLLPTGGVDATEASISEWIKAGAAAVGLGSKLITKRAIQDKDYEGIAKKTSDCISWVKRARDIKK